MAEKLKLENARKYLEAGTVAGNGLIAAYLATGTLDPDAKISGEINIGGQGVMLKDYLVRHYCQVIGSDFDHVLQALAEMYPPQPDQKPAKGRSKKPQTGKDEVTDNA